MTEAKKTSYFKELSAKEKVSKVHNHVLTKGSFIVWSKGTKTRTEFRSHYFDKNELKVHLDKKSTDLVDKTVLYSFQYQSLNFFGTGKLIVENNQLILYCNKDCYKVERRSSFRLLTYPAHKVYLHIKIKGFAAQSNVFQLRTGVSQTGLFNSFLDLLNAHDPGGLGENAIQFRVHDISISGLSFQVGKTEMQFFEEGMVIENFIIEINNQKIAIPKGEIVYVVNTITPPLNVYKIGVKFIGITEEADSKISSSINTLIRVYDTEEFEGIIK